MRGDDEECPKQMDALGPKQQPLNVPLPSAEKAPEDSASLSHLLTDRSISFNRFAEKDEEYGNRVETEGSNRRGTVQNYPEASETTKPQKTMVQMEHVWVGRKKEKSALSLLCEDFLYKFGHVNADGSPHSFLLNAVAAHCGVPRRRMYDVINVLEAIGIVQRTAKLKYAFKGYDNLPNTFTCLAQSENDGAEDNSVGTLTKKMIRVLLNNNGMMALGEMAAKLIGPNVAPQPIKKQRSQRQITIERRLYDIASILTSVGLLEKVQGERRVATIVWTYGWLPNDKHEPPTLDVARMAMEPPPILEPLTDQQIEHSNRKRKSAEKTGEVPQYFSPTNVQMLGSNTIDESNSSRMMLANPSTMLQSFPRHPGILSSQLPGVDGQDYLTAGVDPSALAALLAAQQNMSGISTSQQAGQAPPGMLPTEMPQEIMMQFLYPYMMHQAIPNNSNGDGSSALSPTRKFENKS